MRAARLTLIETLIVLAVGVGLGLGINAVRGEDSINLNRDYRPAPQTQPRKPDGPTPRPKHPYRELGFDETLAIWEDPNREYGLYVFVDARNDKEFEAGHVPGAYQCDFYRIENYIEDAFAAASGAEKVVVYCIGGDCEDSIGVCNVLHDYGIPTENLLLYRGGWEEWNQKQMPVATGRE